MKSDYYTDRHGAHRRSSPEKDMSMTTTNPYYSTHKHAFESLPNDSVICRWCEQGPSDDLHCNVSAPQPAQDAGEWRSRNFEVLDASGHVLFRVAECDRPHAEVTARIVADHRLAAATPALIFALESFLFAPSGKSICACENVNAVKAGMGSPCAYCNARRAIDEALTTVNQTGGGE